MFVSSVPGLEYSKPQGEWVGCPQTEHMLELEATTLPLVASSNHLNEPCHKEKVQVCTHCEKMCFRK